MPVLHPQVNRALTAESFFPDTSVNTSVEVMKPIDLIDRNQGLMGAGYGGKGLNS